MTEKMKHTLQDMLASLNKNKAGMLLMLFSSLCLCIGQLLWKHVKLSSFDLSTLSFPVLLSLALALLPGLLVYAAGAIFMLIAFRKGELSVLQPMNCMSYVFSLLIAGLILHEPITPFMIIGVVIIIAGVICIGGGSK